MWQKAKNIYHFLQSVLASIWYGNPAKKLTVIGVTGTDGKTTTVHLIAEILKAAKFPVSYVSSIEANIGGKILDTGFHVTTPSPIPVQKLLVSAVKAKSKYFVLEVTSHGLDQNRVFGIDFEIGVVTNITSEHLDYHKTFEKYQAAKAKLIERSKTAVLNFDDSSFKFLKSKAIGRIVSFGMSTHSKINPEKFQFKLNLEGNYNIYNALAAIATAKELKIKDQIIRKALLEFKGLVGRMEGVNFGQRFKVFIDFAHTPNALKQALESLKSKLKNQKSKIITVFGVAGERDKMKRPKMGKISAKYADYTILTSEDPRNENADKIISEIAAGLKQTEIKESNILEGPKDRHLKYFFKIPDRFEAIKFAITKLAKDDDIVAIFGKGHENSIAYGNTEYPWSDKKAVEIALKGGTWKILD
jgi:UDP-N-acetylmuramoyl-L-alanyl-D-glutamate--2,6-diaminopimelate ligase